MSGGGGKELRDDTEGFDSSPMSGLGIPPKPLLMVTPADGPLIIVVGATLPIIIPVALTPFPAIIDGCCGIIAVIAPFIEGIGNDPDCSCGGRFWFNCDAS